MHAREVRLAELGDGALRAAALHEPRERLRVARRRGGEAEHAGVRTDAQREEGRLRLGELDRVLARLRERADPLDEDGGGRARRGQG